MNKTKTILLILMIIVMPSLNAQTPNTSSSTASVSALAPVDLTPVEYQKGEIPEALMDARRFEKVMFGVLPLAFYISTLTFDITKYITDSAEYSAGTIKTKPELPKPIGKPVYVTEEKLGILSAALGFCFTVAVVDMIIYKEKKRTKETESRRKVIEQQILGASMSESDEDSSLENLETEIDNGLGDSVNAQSDSESGTQIKTGTEIKIKSEAEIKSESEIKTK